jgi:hypothetical protein
MFNVNDKIIDKKTDHIGLMLNQLLDIPTYTKAKKLLHYDLIKLLEENSYLSFFGHPNKYHLSRIGDSCLYDVPETRRGHLKSFRGKRIRLICVQSGRFDRLLMAGEYK